MTTVEQLIEHLKTLPQQAVVEVTNECGYWVRFCIEDHVEVIDLRDNPSVKEDSQNFGRVFVLLGE